ncbi:MAG: 30S ribosomal protein S8 [Patescibacteria group bacterium]|nr:30S ribosomal protein S8 [Patescibacteria group bacterium]
MTDPISDMLVRLQNAARVGKGALSMPYSRIKHSSLSVLKKEGYVKDVSTTQNGGRKILEISIDPSAIRGIKRISKGSRRVYLGARDLRPVMRGHGLLVLTTPLGVMTGLEARRRGVGGEPLFEIW